MADENKINTRPTIAGRIVEGIKEGIVGGALGAAAGYVTGAAIDVSGVDLSTNVADIDKAAQGTINDTAEKLVSNTNQVLENVKNIPKDTGKYISDAFEALGASAANDPNASKDLSKAIDGAVESMKEGFKPISVTETGHAIQAKETVDALHENTKTFLDVSFQNQADRLTDKETLAAVGAVAGGTFKAGEGLLSSQSDKRQDAENAIQEQQIQGVGQLAGMALAASASANEGLKVVGQHTARLMQERNQQRSDSPTLGA